MHGLIFCRDGKLKAHVRRIGKMFGATVTAQPIDRSMSARDAADSLVSLQRLFNQTNLLVITPSAQTFSAQDLHLHSPHDLKAGLKVKSSDEPPNRTRRPPPAYDYPHF